MVRKLRFEGWFGGSGSKDPRTEPNPEPLAELNPNRTRTVTAKVQICRIRGSFPLQRQNFSARQSLPNAPVLRHFRGFPAVYNRTLDGHRSALADRNIDNQLLVTGYETDKLSAEVTFEAVSMLEDSKQEADAASDLAPGRRSRGRPRGFGKVPGSGRAKGVGNKVNRDAKELIRSRGKPIEFLCDVVRGLKVRVGPQAGPGRAEYAYPSLAERIRAAEALADRIEPRLKASEITGKDGAAFSPVQINFTQDDLAVCAGYPEGSAKHREANPHRYDSAGNLLPEGSGNVTSSITHSFDVTPPTPAPRPRAQIVELGVIEELPGGWAVRLHFVEPSTGRQKWAVHGPAGDVQTMVWGKDEATAFAAAHTKPDPFTTKLDTRVC